MRSLFISNSDYKLRHAAYFLLMGGLLLAISCLVQYQLLQGVLNSSQVILGEDKTVLYIGDSHCVRSFNPDVAAFGGGGGWANVGQMSENILCSYYKLKFLIQKNPQIKTVVVTCSPHNISSNTDRSFFSDSADVKFNRYYALFDKDGIRYAAHNKTINFRAYLTYKLYLPLEWDRRTLKLLKKKQMPFMGGFQPNKAKTNQENHITAAIERHYFFEGDEAQPSSYQIEYLEKMGKLSAEYGFKLLLATTPLHPGYVESIPATLDTTFYNLMAEMEKKYSNVIYIDSRNAFSNTTYFYDGDHLNANGAMKFSTYFFEKYLATSTITQNTLND